MLFSEPITTLTDYAIAVECFWFAARLLPMRQTSVRCWGVAFGLVAIAALLGGTWHGLAAHISLLAQTMLWQAMLYALGLSSAALLVGTIVSVVPCRWQGWAIAAVGLKLAVYLHQVTPGGVFADAVIDYLTALGLVVVLQCVPQWAIAPGGSSTAASWMLAGVVLSGVAVSLLQTSLAAPLGLTANDVYHLAQMIGLYLFYRGAQQLKDREGSWIK
ncbi:MAG TPA: hypothetical protein V6C88_12595 [Chroococcidiopsis sp.]